VSPSFDTLAHALLLTGDQGAAAVDRDDGLRERRRSSWDTELMMARSRCQETGEFQVTGCELGSKQAAARGRRGTPGQPVAQPDLICHNETTLGAQIPLWLLGIAPTEHKIAYCRLNGIWHG